MKRLAARWLFACGMLGLALPALAVSDEFRFAVIGHPFSDSLGDDTALRKALAETDEDNLAFVVVGGIKSPAEPCSDRIYEQRKALFEYAKNGVIVSIAASDWSECRYSNGRPAAVERLNRLRELFFTGDFSLGASKLPLVRQSAIAKFRDYGENVRWEFGNIMFATLNLPANNNRYLSAAGRNNEFEDRLIANHDWLQRVFTFSKQKKAPGIVIFCDGSPVTEPTGLNGMRDGFAETRQLLETLTAKFPGKVLIIHNRIPISGATSTDIAWRCNLGGLSVASGWTRLTVKSGRATLFSVNGEPDEKTGPSQK
jgi:hypothetical protein